MTSTDTATKIRELNDAFRATTTARFGPWIGSGQLFITRGVASRGDDFVAHAVAAVHAFSNFTPSNDPWGEHDYGAFDLNGERLMWKIDYYDAALEMGSEDPADIMKTRRVLTILLAEEY